MQIENMMAALQSCSQKVNPSVANGRVANMGLLCALLIVIIHSGWEAVPGSCNWWVRQIVWGGLARIAVPFFFAASGYFLAAHFDEDGFWKREVLKRIRTLLVPFVLWSIIAFLVSSPLGIVADQIAHRPFLSSLPVHDGRWMRVLGLDVFAMPSLYPLWFVRNLFLLVLISPVLKLMIVRFGVLWLLISFAFMCWFDAGGTKALGPHLHEFLVNTFNPMGMFYFSAGIYVRRAGKFCCGRKMIFSCLFVGLAFVIFDAVAASLQIKVIVNLVSCGLPMLLCGVFGIVLDRSLPAWIVKCAFPIYLMHIIVLRYFFCIWDNVVRIGGGPRALCAWSCGVLGSVLITLALRRCSPRWAGLLFGGR